MPNFNLRLLDTGHTYVEPGVPRQDISLDTEFQQAPDLTCNVGIQYDASLGNGGSVTTCLDIALTVNFWFWLDRADSNNASGPQGSSALSFGIAVVFQLQSRDSVRQEQTQCVN